jgi:hypothetical protein
MAYAPLKNIFCKHGLKDRKKLSNLDYFFRDFRYKFHIILCTNMANELFPPNVILFFFFLFAVDSMPET